jgi:hypothetical protein
MATGLEAIVFALSPLLEEGFPVHSHHQTKPGWRSRAKIALYVFLGIAAFFLITEHLAHLIPILPWLFLLLCPLMHLFMHGGHGGHGENHDQSPH